MSYTSTIHDEAQAQFQITEFKVIFTLVIATRIVDPHELFTSTAGVVLNQNQQSLYGKGYVQCGIVYSL